MIEVHVYGKLRHRLPEAERENKVVVQLEPHPEETVTTLLARLGLQPAEIYHIFLNGSLLATHNAMAPWLGYRQAREDVWDWDTEISVKAGDRVGLFGEDMAALVV